MSRLPDLRQGRWLLHPFGVIELPAAAAGIAPGHDQQVHFYCTFSPGTTMIQCDAW
jgi:hypothetical protein